MKSLITVRFCITDPIDLKLYDMLSRSIKVIYFLATDLQLEILSIKNSKSDHLPTDYFQKNNVQSL